jgi:hypothetical protein
MAMRKLYPTSSSARTWRRSTASRLSRQRHREIAPRAFLIVIDDVEYRHFKSRASSRLALIIKPTSVTLARFGNGTMRYMATELALHHNVRAHRSLLLLCLRMCGHCRHVLFAAGAALPLGPSSSSMTKYASKDIQSSQTVVGVCTQPRLRKGLLLTHP